VIISLYTEKLRDEQVSYQKARNYEMDILLTFVGNNDCYLPDKPGPIIGILERREFQKVYLLYNHEKYLSAASQILKYAAKHFPEISIKYIDAFAVNPIDYNTVYPAMYHAIQSILQENPEASYTISLTSGTPTMHACWLLLAHGGAIKARLIQISKESGIEEVTFSLDDFPKILTVDAAKVEMTKLARENQCLKARLGLPLHRIVGECPQMQILKERIKLFAEIGISVYIQGETGTGKELVAEALHYLSSRREKPFVPINCGAIPAHLFESEFFGHKRGAFTGAIAEKRGLLKEADGGTVFFDEVNELPPEMQVKLLRVIQEKSFFPVGSTKPVKSDFRILSASNKVLKQLVHQGNFREDLYYRLVSNELILPPLRERGYDKILIAQHFIAELNKKYDLNKRFSTEALKIISDASWPGNVRQLYNVIEASMVYPDNVIKPEHLSINEVSRIETKPLIPETGINLEKDILPRYYMAALEKTSGNAEKAAHLLGLAPHTFRARIRKLRITGSSVY